MSNLAKFNFLVFLFGMFFSRCAEKKRNKFLIRNLFLGQGRFTILLALASAGITTSCAVTDIDQESSCYELSNPEAKEQLLKLDGKVVCVAGKLTLEPHEVYFALGNNSGSDPELFFLGNRQPNRVYLDMRFGEALRAGLLDGQFYSFSGLLSVEKIGIHEKVYFWLTMISGESGAVNK